MPVPTVELNPDDFVIVPNVYVLDEFDMTDDEGNVVARIDAKYIEKTCRWMAEREATTGDLCPIVIGHTKEGVVQGDAEVNGPPLIGYFRNWKQIPFFETGKTAAAPDAWIFKIDVERARKFPRRSAEVHVARHEIDPVSFLGATTPARDLGLLKLSRGSSFVYSIGIDSSIFDQPTRLCRSGKCAIPTNRETSMAEGNTKPPADPKQSGESKGLEGKLDMLISMMQSWMEKSQGSPAAAPASTDASAAPASGDGSDQPLSDDELNQYLSQMGGEGGEGAGGDDSAVDAGAAGDKDKSRKGDKVVQNSAGYAGGNDTNVPAMDEMKKKLSRVEEENAVIRLKLSRTEIQARLRTAVERDGAVIDANDEKLITSLVAMPEDMREDMVVRLSRVKSQTARDGHAGDALRTATDGGKKNRVSTPEDQKKVIKLARQKGISYDQAVVEAGFEIG